MAIKAIVSYDGTPNDDDAVALAKVLGHAGADLVLTYVRHSDDANSATPRQMVDLLKGIAAVAFARWLYSLPTVASTAPSAIDLDAWLPWAIAAAALPGMALAAYLTLSRGGAIEIAAALICFHALASSRARSLATLVPVAIGSVILIYQIFNF